MSLVVGFLSLLSAEAEHGGVKRMLGVCSEFERVAKVVLDKAEKENSSRRKRKSDVSQDMKTKHAPPPPMPNNGAMPNMAGMFSPQMNGANMQQNGYGASPMNNQGSPANTWNPETEFAHDFSNPVAGMGYQDLGYATNGQMNSPLNMNNFQQPLIPQDLWQMPMSLDYDWAGLTGGQYPSFENGVMGDPLLQNVNNQHLQHQPM
jgi:hypothetical protein